MRASLLFVALLLCVTSPLAAQAQLFDTTPVTLSIFPEYPRPYDVVTVTPQSNLLNLGSSRVTITANGAVIEEGSGARSAQVTLGAPGSRTTIRVTVVSEGTTYTTETTIRPTDVALVLEPKTTTHPLYEGASLPAPEGPIRIVAVPDFRSASGARIPANSLSYTWRLGNRILTQESGIGRSVLSATAPVRYRNADLSVTVTTTDDSLAGYAEAEVSPASPEVYVYRFDPLLGIDFAHALSGAFSLASEEETFRAVPFHFAKTPSLEWTLSGNAASSDDSLTVRTTSSGAGSAPVDVAASVESGESARAGFTINFNASRSRGIFGF